MTNRIFNHIAGCLSLRPPQEESLTRLARTLDAAPEMLRRALQAVAESRDTGDLSAMEDPQALQQVVDVMQGA